MEGNIMSDESKAIEEVAKTTGKAIDLGRAVGSFISKYVGGTVEQGIGIFEDKLKYIRWERQMRLMQRADEFMKSSGLQAPNKSIQLKLALPLLQAATLEENDYLQDLWAKLLVNSSNENSKVELIRTYIDILERLEPLDALILEKIYSLNYQETVHIGITTKHLPDSVSIVNGEIRDDANSLPNEGVLLSLTNLARLGCISLSKSWGGGEIFSAVHPTLLGRYFVNACTLKN